MNVSYFLVISPSLSHQLIQDCWDDNPSNRPSFSQIRATLHRINPSKLSPVDMMMQLMEKYSKHLESLVAERTQDLLLEKQKTDRLLYSECHFIGYQDAGEEKGGCGDFCPGILFAGEHQIYDTHLCQ